MPRLWHTLYLVIIAVLLATLLHRSRIAPSALDVPQRFQDALIEHTDNFGHVTWLGQPVWQSVLDLWTLQETLAEVRPALVVECGTYKGGSALFMAHLFDLMNHGRVITVDIERLHELSHPRITFLIGDCASAAIADQIRRWTTLARGASLSPITPAVGFAASRQMPRTESPWSRATCAMASDSEPLW